MNTTQQVKQPSFTNSIIVRDDGTFDAQIDIPKNWQPDSQHVIEAQAVGQDGRAQTQAQRTVTMPVESPGGVLSSPTPTPIPTPTTTTSTTTTSISVPGISKIRPTSGPAGTPIIITGSGFTKAISVSFGLAPVLCGVDNTCTVDSDTQIKVVSPAENSSDASASVPVDITVTTPNGTSTKSSADQFAYAPLPTITSINPLSGSVNGGTSVTISGSGFTGATGFSFGKAMVDCAVSSCKVNSDGTQITVTSPAEDPSDASSNFVDVTVTTTNGTSQTSSADQFTYTASPQPPAMQLSANSLTFGPLGCNSSQSQQITITNGGGGTLTWTVDTSSQPSWLTVTPTNGSAPSTLKFTATIGLSNTSNHTTVNITGSDGTTQTVTVTLTVQCIG